jgi:hypothetical protein
MGVSKFLELYFCNFRLIRKYLGGRWVSQGWDKPDWVRWNDPGDELFWPQPLKQMGFILEEYK